MPPSHVLVVLDGSPRAEAALEHALVEYDCTITVLNVITPVDAGMSEGSILDPDDEREREARERAERLAAEADATAPTVEPVVVADTPVDAVLDYLSEHDVDHVVMGGHGGPRHEIVERILGTVATEVADAAEVPVTIVR
ncbi:universal stress protein UspA-like protein [Salinarchaeum sp. Harcht-Bsk1]|uniref:universal stress protein n=1 Tax=Salinarchaeum sp. Harcht-Bsk1 TaxID=1333523 RepID=UPI0003423181|nr:universal stress protein [Salinarchaeum sp. Harcht-Bsk1]AGN01069.1 universal stress protein UspA-like protein [Salinarchaeum sp. Harcht-Bsk1]